MKTHLEFANLAGIETEVLVVLAGDAQTDKGAKPELVLLTDGRDGEGRRGGGAGFGRVQGRGE
jgi:hypothetical protein